MLELYQANLHLPDDAMTEYDRLGYARKPEHMGWNDNDSPISRTELRPIGYGDEARQRLDRYAALTRAAFARIEAETNYFNRRVAGGKRNYMMSSNPRSLAVFDLPATAAIAAAHLPKFVESGGVVSMEAEHFSHRTDRNGAGWRAIPDLVPSREGARLDHRSPHPADSCGPASALCRDDR